jgi:hypothetical protein
MALLQLAQHQAAMWRELKADLARFREEARQASLNGQAVSAYSAPVFDSLAGFPAAGICGRMAVDKATGRLYIDDGTTWKFHAEHADTADLAAEATEALQVKLYASWGDIPLANASTYGHIACITGTGKLYFCNGASWKEVSLL